MVIPQATGKVPRSWFGLKLPVLDHARADISAGIVVFLVALPLCLGVALASLAGMLIAPLSSVYPYMGSQVLIMCFVVVVIGGIGSVRGALTAALLVGLVDTFGKVLLPQFASMLVYVLMALVLLYKPEGLFKQ